MGQANKRGSFEQRKAQAVARRAAETAEADAHADREYAERMRMKMHMRKAHGCADVSRARVGILGAAHMIGMLSHANAEVNE